MRKGPLAAQIKRQKGLFEMADKGTYFSMNLGEMSLELGRPITAPG